MADGWAANIQGETTKAPRGALLGAGSAAAHSRPDTAGKSEEQGSALRSGQVWPTPSIHSSLVPG